MIMFMSKLGLNLRLYTELCIYENNLKKQQIIIKIKIINNLYL
jgi:hypothetical protein